MDGTSGIALPNRSILPVIRDSNCSWWTFINGLKLAGLNWMGHVTIYISGTRGRIAKPMPALDWPARLSLNAPSYGIPSLVWRPACMESKIGSIGLIGDVIDYSIATSRNSAKRMVPLDSGHRIGVTILWKELLVALGSIRGPGYYIYGIWGRNFVRFWW